MFVYYFRQEEDSDSKLKWSKFKCYRRAKAIWNYGKLEGSLVDA